VLGVRNIDLLSKVGFSQRMKGPRDDGCRGLWTARPRQRTTSSSVRGDGARRLGVVIAVLVGCGAMGAPLASATSRTSVSSHVRVASRETGGCGPFRTTLPARAPPPSHGATVDLAAAADYLTSLVVNYAHAVGGRDAAAVTVSHGPYNPPTLRVHIRIPHSARGVSAEYVLKLEFIDGCLLGVGIAEIRIEPHYAAGRPTGAQETIREFTIYYDSGRAESDTSLWSFENKYESNVKEPHAFSGGARKVVCGPTGPLPAALFHEVNDMFASALRRRSFDSVPTRIICPSKPTIIGYGPGPEAPRPRYADVERALRQLARIVKRYAAEAERLKATTTRTAEGDDRSLLTVRLSGELYEGEGDVDYTLSIELRHGRPRTFRLAYTTEELGSYSAEDKWGRTSEQNFMLEEGYGDIWADKITSNGYTGAHGGGFDQECNSNRGYDALPLPLYKEVVLLADAAGLHARIDTVQPEIYCELPYGVDPNLVIGT
jgi:hypothetical protein